INITINPEDEDRDQANWNLTVEFVPPGTDQQQEPPTPTFTPTPVTSQPPADLVADIVRTGVDGAGDFVSGALAFQVLAYDPNVGNDDGDGIDYVDLVVVGPDGGVVYAKREETAAYCAFGGGAPCQPWVFGDNDSSWPGNVPF